MKKLIFISTFIFALSSWSWSVVSMRLNGKDYIAEYSLLPFMPNGQPLGTVVATTQGNGECKGNYALYKGMLAIFFDGPNGIGSEGGCADESIIIYMDDKGLSVLNDGEVNADAFVKWEAYFLGDDCEPEGGTITIISRKE